MKHAKSGIATVVETICRACSMSRVSHALAAIFLSTHAAFGSMCSYRYDVCSAHWRRKDNSRRHALFDQIVVVAFDNERGASGSAINKFTAKAASARDLVRLGQCYTALS
ncbi:MAG: hypothetical protein ABL959_20180 [Pyrinomonadaceae bacterium]